MQTPSWRLVVTGFGPIKSAEIDLAPLVLLVGKNNTGKSYVASLLWSILNPHVLFSRLQNLADELKNPCLELTRSIADGRKKKIEKSDWELIALWINGVFGESKAEIGGRVIGSENCSYDHIAISLNELPGSLAIEFRDRPATKKSGADSRIRLASFRVLRDKLIIFVSEGQEFGPADGIRLLLLLTRILLVGRDRSSAVYLPAARTGLVLALRTLVAGLFRNFEKDEADTPRTTLPPAVVDFLEEFHFRMDMPTELHEHNDIAQNIERSILNGELQQTENDELLFKPTGTDSALPLHAVSSLVTELTPLIVLLKSDLAGHTLIFEEPEAHLHLEAQRMLARSLARVVNSGVQLIVTTHSDTFLQQLNILMELHEHPKKDQLLAELGYREDELINPALSNGFLFEGSNDGTVVRQMTKTKSGFIEPIMNKTIADLTKEAIHIDGAYAEDRNV